MSIEKKIAAALEAELATFTANTLRRPPGKEAFDFGNVVGFTAGLDRALKIVWEVVSGVEREEANR